MERLAIIYHQSFIDSVLLYHPVDIGQEGPVGVLLLLLTPLQCRCSAVQVKLTLYDTTVKVRVQGLHPHLDGGVVEGQLHLLTLTVVS